MVLVHGKYNMLIMMIASIGSSCHSAEQYFWHHRPLKK